MKFTGMVAVDLLVIAAVVSIGFIGYTVISGIAHFISLASY